MKDEIKEILDRWNKVCNNELEYVELTLEQMKLLLDYITNLQEENDRLKALNKEYVYELGLNEFEHTTIIDTDYKDKYLDYKSRNEKAIEYINSSHFIYDVQYKKKDKLENILNGDDE